MASSSFRIILRTTTLIALSAILTVDAQRFPYPAKNSVVDFWGKRTGFVDLFFIYEIPNKYLLGAINCGFEGEDHRVWKRRLHPAIVLRPFVGTTKVIRDMTGQQIMIRVLNLELKYTRRYFSCFMAYSGLQYSSGKYFLHIYEPIRIVDCLNVGITNKKRERFELNEGDTLSSTCLVYGIPIPYIQCSLRNNLDEVLTGAETKRVQRNFTKKFGESIRFNNVRRTAYRVKCIIDGGKAVRKTFAFREIAVDFKPGAPEKLVAIAITTTSIKFRWTAPKKETGRSNVTAYNLTALPLNRTKKTDQTGNVAITTVNLLEYTFSDLQVGTYYRISVAAFNKAGQGKPKHATFKTAPLVKGLSLIKIIALGAGALVVLLVIMCCCCLCCCRRKEIQEERYDRRDHQKRARRRKADSLDSLDSLSDVERRQSEARKSKKSGRSMKNPQDHERHSSRSGGRATQSQRQPPAHGGKERHSSKNKRPPSRR